MLIPLRSRINQPQFFKKLIIQMLNLFYLYYCNYTQYNMKNIKQYINQQIRLAYDQSGIDCAIENKFLNVMYFGTPYDYSNKSLMGLSKFLGSKGINKSVQELFAILTRCLDPAFFEVVFDRNALNINLKTDFVIQLIKQRNFLDLVTPGPKQRILCDFSSPNIAKDMHVGHLRSTIIGDSICKLYELLGHDIKRVNHIGDFGTQFGMIIQHLLEVYPDYENCNLTIADLQKFYAASKKRFDTEPNFKVKAYEKVVLLQQGDPEVIKAWNFIKDISRQSYDVIYKKLGICNLEECGESFYQPYIPNLIEELEGSGLLELDEGRKIIKVEGFLEDDDVPLTVVKTDGGFTYDTTDLAAVKYRLVNLNMDKIIYVTDLGQASHFDMIFKVAEKMGWKKNYQELKHVGFGLVLGMDGKKLKSRAGDTVKLMELLDEAIIKSRDMAKAQQDLRGEDKKVILTEAEQENINQIIAYGSIKYADLASTRTNDYKFAFDKMINLKGNTFAYNAYELVRINAILRKAEGFTDNININDFTVVEKEEIGVCKLLLLFPEIIDTLAEDLMFHKLCAYLYNLTCAFSVFHKECRCMNFNEQKELINVNVNRILICQLTKEVLEKCFDILGLQRIEKM